MHLVEDDHAHWPTRTLRSFSEFEEAIDEILISDPKKPTTCFRGQADESWPLIPSLARCIEGDLTTSQVYAIEEHAIKSFQKRAPLLLNPSLLPEHNQVFDWLPIMQHFNAPTRLLDWTYSPYVALYFAVQDLFTQNGSVWFFDSHFLEIGRNALLQGRPQWLPMGEPQVPTWQWSLLAASDPESVVYEYSSQRIPKGLAPGNERYIVQQGTFTVGAKLKDDHSHIIHKTIEKIHLQNKSYFKEDVKPKNYCKFVVPYSSKRSFLRKLEQMNITASSLFPGLDGLGRSITGQVNIHVQWMYDEKTNPNRGLDRLAVYGLPIFGMAHTGTNEHGTVRETVDLIPHDNNLASQLGKIITPSGLAFKTPPPIVPDDPPSDDQKL